MAVARLDRLTAFLERDPNNPNLLDDAAQAAFEAGDVSLAESFLARRESVAALTPPLINLKALLALARGDHEEASSLFAALRRTDDDPALRFNLAWAYMMLGRYEEAERLLDDDAVNASPRGPALKIQALHHLERYDDGLEIGAELALRYPEDQALMAALATLAMDAGRLDLAQSYGERAGDSPEGLTTRGLIALDRHESDEAITLFERALALAPTNARSWVGKGLVLLQGGRPQEAALSIEKGAALFEDHLGSWVAAGWAWFLSGDTGAARAAFERVVALDATFSEGHGGLAVLDLVDGQLEAAEHNSRVALRLDRASLGGALAASLLADASGQEDMARTIRTAAISYPIGPRGETLGELLRGMGTRLFQ